jgi:iron complex transport system permease protein
MAHGSSQTREVLGAVPPPLPEGVRYFTLGRVLGLCAVFAVLGVVALLMTACLGEWSIPLMAVFTEPESMDAKIFWQMRLPRALLGAIVGAGLAASGATLQGVLRNPLAEPFVLGVSGGAALGATLAVAAGLATVKEVAPGLSGALARLSAPSLFAFVGAGATLLFVLAASRRAGGRVPATALLTGVVFNAFASAVITLVKVMSRPEKLEEILHWLVGTLGNEEPQTLALAALLQGVALAVMLALSGRLNLLGLGDEDAAALGVPVESTRLWLLVAASASVAGAVALSGMIGFVGLIVPHVLRLVLGPDQRLLVPLSALGGATFLMLADLAARLIYPLFRQMLPVGVITALVGGALFLGLLYRRGRV